MVGGGIGHLVGVEERVQRAVPVHNPEIQLPERALSDRTSDHEYAMWRFVQFLDDRGYIGPAGGAWPLEREVIAGYGNVNQALESGLKSRGTTLADELSMFWGDRLKAQPMHGPALRPTELRTVKVAPGTTTVTPKAGPLKTWFKNYKVANEVKRVTFHFEPNGGTEGGQVWGAVTRFRVAAHARGRDGLVLRRRRQRRRPRLAAARLPDHRSRTATSPAAG